MKQTRVFVSLVWWSEALLVHCWTFNSIYVSRNKMLDPWNAEEGIYPIPYERTETNTIDEENPPEPPDEDYILIFPYTKWCGPGNIAVNYHDLGEKNQTDRCCRDHDYCDDIIPAKHTAHGLINEDFFTKLNCGCDDIFFDCLHKSMDGIGDIIGRLYFNAIGTQCFRLEHPIVRCLKYRGSLRKKCLEYEFDVTQPMIYQWFDVQPYV